MCREKRGGKGARRRGRVALGQQGLHAPLSGSRLPEMDVRPGGPDYSARFSGTTSISISSRRWPSVELSAPNRRDERKKAPTRTWRMRA